MIVRNEEKNLEACLASAADLVDEVIVTDTGSADRTKEIAARFGAKVVDFPWVDSFAAARNESLRHATGAWVWWLDADDRIDEENRAKLRALFAQLGDENVAYVMKVRSATGPDTKSARLLDQVRLFRNHPYVRWRYRVHEQILPAVGQWGGQSRWTDIVIDHTGYQNEAFRKRKLQRNLRLLELEVKEQPDDAFTLFNLGRSYLDLGRTAEALPIFQRSLERSGRNLSIVRKLYALLTQNHWQLKQADEALAVCREGLSRFPDDAELLFQQSLLLREKKDWPGTEAALRRLLESKPGEYFDLVDAGVRTYKAHQQLAEVYQHQGRKQEAEAAWRAALQSRPDWLPALRGQAELYLDQQRWDDLQAILAQLEMLVPESPETAFLRGRAHLAREEYPAARHVFASLAANAPKALGPRVLLSHALIREAKDWPAAEQALRDVLTLDPNHSESRHNLAVLLRQQGKGTGDSAAPGGEPSPALKFSESES
jgi:tetratricopeptide (TPR) repeat protein